MLVAEGWPNSWFRGTISPPGEVSTSVFQLLPTMQKGFGGPPGLDENAHTLDPPVIEGADE
jgi:hypothetical protein